MPGRQQAIVWTNAEIIVNSNIRNKLRWNRNWNLYIFFQENAFENVVCEMVAILSGYHWVDYFREELFACMFISKYICFYFTNCEHC